MILQVLAGRGRAYFLKDLFFKDMIKQTLHVSNLGDPRFLRCQTSSVKAKLHHLKIFVLDRNVKFSNHSLKKNWHIKI